MPNLKKKSEENFNAAILLMDKNMSAASIHCLYYSCFQLSKYMLKYECGIEYDIQDKESSGERSHSYVINEISKKIDSVSHIAFLDFKSKISKLKKMRRKADYTNEVILEKEAISAYKTTNDIITILNKKLTA